MQDSKKSYFKVHEAQWNGLDKIFTHTPVCEEKSICRINIQSIVRYKSSEL